MAKKRKIITSIRESVENRIRQWCRKIPPGKRIAVILTLLFLFAGLSLYITFSSLVNFGKDEREKLNFKHIEGLQLELEEIRNKPDSLKPSNEFKYEKKREQ
jgi:hypothetical protein